jgi:hypothetical protein
MFKYKPTAQDHQATEGKLKHKDNTKTKGLGTVTYACNSIY